MTIYATFIPGIVCGIELPHTTDGSFIVQIHLFVLSIQIQWAQ